MKKYFFLLISTLLISFIVLLLNPFTSFLYQKQALVYAAPVTTTFQITDSANDVNEVNTTFDTTSATDWIGTGGSTTSSYAGFRFTNVSIPQAAIITSARIELYSVQNQWLTIGYEIAGENTGSSTSFSTNSRPSQRTLTTARVNHNSDIQWLADTWYQTDNFSSVVQEIVNRSDWASGNSMSFIFHGTVGTWGRKFVRSFDGTPVFAPRLVVTYDSGSGPTPTPTPTSAPSPTPTPTPIPSGFQNQTLILGLTQPTVMQFLPDGRMLIGERLGTIKIVQAGATSVDPTPFLTLTNINTDQGERGLTGIALDPNFATNNYMYLFYTANSPLRDRVSRFTVTGNTADLASQVVIWEDNVDAHFWHHGGTIAFGSDGKLYISTGDHFDSGVGSNHASQRLDSYHGKILRVNSDGTVPTDNPFYDGVGPNLDAIWARGLRNPFRFSFDSATGKMYIADVGANDPSVSIEELNLGVAGANYGWPICEGTCATAGMTNPIFQYSHGGRDASITGGFVYHGTQFPLSHQNSYFFADYAQNWIKRLTFNADGSVNQNLNFWPEDGTADTAIGDPVDLKEGPDGALYYVDVALDEFGNPRGPGTVRKISYFSGNLPPVISSATASPTIGVVPLNVTFTASASDPDNDPLTYTWSFGDGQNGIGATVSHTYTAAGTYSARVTVSDGSHNTLSNPITIQVGQPPTVTISSPIDNSTFRAGNVISYSATASDPNGTLTESSYSWTITFHHEGHVHPGAGPITGSSGTFTIPTSGHDFSGNTRYEFIVTVTDSEGLTDTKSVFIFPEKVNITLQTVPTGLQLSLDAITQTAPFIKDALIGFQHTLTAGNQQVLNGKTYQFVSWSDGGLATHTITVPTINTTYTANYQEVTSDITGVVYIDENRNGAQEIREIGYQGATINLIGATSATATTSANGSYSFVDRSLGNYTVTLTAPSGYDITTSNPVNIVLGPDTTVNFGIAARVNPVTVTRQVGASTDDVNEVGTSYSENSTPAWIGTGGSATASYLGLRFTNVTIPQGASIVSAHFEVYSSQNQWIGVGYDIAADATGNSSVFTSSNKPSQRTLSIQKVSHTSDSQWLANTWYSSNEINSVIQEIVNRPDWQSGNSLSLIMKGTVGTWGRKFFQSFDGSAINAPKLVITYK